MTSAGYKLTTRRKIELIVQVTFGVALASFGLLVLVATLVVAATNSFVPHTTHALKVGTVAFGLTIGALGIGVSSWILTNMRRAIRYERQTAKALQASSLPDRARRAGLALQEATTLVEELKKELDARTAILDSIKLQAAETSRRIEDMEKLAKVDSDTARILNNYFDEALTSRLTSLESRSQRRELLLGTIGAIIFGIVAIFLSHYIFGF
jgi:hypothetical protein